MDIADQIDRFLNTAQRARDARSGSERRAALQRLLSRYADVLRAERDVLAEKLASGDDWLREHQDHPQFVQLEDQWINEWLVTYQSICDALDQGLTDWLMEGSAA